MKIIDNFKKYQMRRYQANANNKQTEDQSQINKIPDEKLERIKKAIFLCANKSSVKTCEISFINDLLLRNKIHPFLNNDPKALEASQLILFFTWNIFPLHNINKLNWLYPVNYLQEFNNLDALGVEEKGKGLPYNNFGLNVQNTYQAADAGLKAAAVENIEGYLIEDLYYYEIDELLQLRKNGFRSVVFLALNNNKFTN